MITLPLRCCRPECTKHYVLVRFTLFLFSQRLKLNFSGAVPVILGGDQIKLAYDEVIQWGRVAIFLPKARVTELHFLLRTIPDEDIVRFRRQGRLVWERYLASVQSTLDTVVAVLRQRLNIPPLPADTVAAISVFNETFQPLLGKNIPGRVLQLVKFSFQFLWLVKLNKKRV